MAAGPEVLTKPWPLTGRHELLEDACDAVADGCPAYFIVGEAGAGKTRLAREILRQLERDGWHVAGATATDTARATPLGALAHLVPSGAIDSPPTLFAATREAIAERAGGQPLVLHVDDAHHLDPSSATLLVSLAEAGAVRLVFTMRSGLRAPEAITALRASHGARSVTLGALDADAIDSLLHRVLGAPLDGVAEAELVATSGGNPLFLRELVLAAVAEGSLQNVTGVWRLTGPLPASDALGDQVLGRMSSLTEVAREALELVAVAEPVGLDLLEALVGGEVLEVLEERSLIRVDQEQRRSNVRLAHPVYGEILRSSIGRVRLRRLSRLLAETVSARGARRSDDPLRVVRWQIDAGIPPDADVVMASARVAHHNMDWPTVAAMSRAALENGVPDAAALLAEAHFELGEFDEVDAVTERALAAPELLSDEARSQLHRSKALSLTWGHDDSAGGIAEVEAARPTVTDPLARDLLVFSQAGLLAWAGRVREARELVEPLVASDDPRVAVQAATIVELVAATCGPTQQAIDLADTWFPVHLGLTDRTGTNNPGNHLITKTVALSHAGRLAEAHELAEFGYGSSVASRSLIGQMWFALELGRIAMLRGDAAQSQRWYREHVALCRGTGHRRPITLGLSGLAVAEAHLGDAEAARRVVDEIDRDPTAVIEIFAIERARGTAWALAAGGDATAARRALIEAAETAEAQGITMLAALARLDALRLGDTNQAAPLASAAAVVDSAIVELAARWAASPNDGAELDAVAEGLAELGCLMFAAEAFAAAATAWRRGGEPRKATADERRADELLRRCRGANVAALTTVDSVVPLTAREREIVLLVAEGMSTKEVAERLFLSARTVSNHLQNAYTKLGISKRSELAAALSRLGGEDAVA
ncbi:MAG: LuxR C-terminal-related transcriptional regulator [Aquihabitans sp.]